MCRHTLSIAEIVPFTFATQIVLSPSSNSFASPAGGSSDSLASRWNMAIGKADYFGCSVCAIITWRLKFSTMFSCKRTSVGFLASDI